jgi:hypothetical protein
MKAFICLVTASIVLAATAVRDHLADEMRMSRKSGNEPLVIKDCGGDGTAVRIPDKYGEVETFFTDKCPIFADVAATAFMARVKDLETFYAWVGDCDKKYTYADTMRTPCFAHSIIKHKYDVLHHGLCTDDDECDPYEKGMERGGSWPDTVDDVICQKFIIGGNEGEHGLCFPAKPEEDATTQQSTEAATTTQVATTTKQSTEAATTTQAATTTKQSTEAATTTQAATTTKQSTQAATTTEAATTTKQSTVAATTTEQSTKAATTPEKPAEVVMMAEQPTEPATTPGHLTKAATTPMPPKNGAADSSAGVFLTAVLSPAVYFLL